MPHSSEEPQIHPSVPGPRNAAAAARTPQAPRPAVPGPRPGPRPAPPRADSSRPGPGRPGPSRTAPSPAPAAAPTASSTATAAGIQLVTATAATAVEAADETVDRLLDEGGAPTDILILTTGEQHPWAQHELSFGEDAYWRQQAEGGDIFYAHTSAAARLMARPVVVLAVNGGTDTEVAEALPVALGRAKAQLIVCGDPQRLRALL
ncbi:hypothetical protein [Streptomyces gobiensis]|uniref:hypothetical protein n=1 Tax=Streptomyces gobiensis TaxID=2875706 RepID=UPI001E42257F|nr:hypothetical protein [Streptomyces gobiensis]UGY94025.1 hypothetical protein test1122_21445 [Streptomyces gobiensis]